jgi:hypothetical protein
VAWIDLISEMVLIKLHKWRLLYKSLRHKNTKERNKQGTENGTVVELTGMASLTAVGACELSHCKTRGLWKSEINYRTVLLNLEKITTKCFNKNNFMTFPVLFIRKYSSGVVLSTNKQFYI